MKASHHSDNQPTAENVQEAGRGSPLPRLVRLDWESTCDCLRVAVDVRERGRNESLPNYAARWTMTVKAAYERGAGCNYNVDCPKCVCGVISEPNA